MLSRQEYIKFFKQQQLIILYSIRTDFTKLNLKIMCVDCSVFTEEHR